MHNLKTQEWGNHNIKRTGVEQYDQLNLEIRLNKNDVLNVLRKLMQMSKELT